MKHLKNRIDFICEKSLLEAGIVMLEFDFPELSEIRKQIDTNDIYPYTNHIPKTPHITILNNIHRSEIEGQRVIDILVESGISDKIVNNTFSLGNASIFKNDKFHVLKINILDNRNLLFEANELLREQIPYTPRFDTYIPHVTIEFFKKNKAERYLEMLNNKTFSIHPNCLIYNDNLNTSNSIKMICSKLDKELVDTVTYNTNID